MSEIEKIEVSKTELEAMMADNQGLRAQLNTLMEAVQSLTSKQQESSGPKVLSQIKERKVRITFVNGKPVIGFANRGTERTKSYVYEKPDPNNKNNRLLYIDLILKGQEEPISVNYNEFLREGEAVECVVKSRDEKPWKIEHGMVRQKMVEEYSMVETSVLVPLDVMGVDVKFTVELPSGELLEVDEKYVNII